MWHYKTNIMRMKFLISFWGFFAICIIANSQAIEKQSITEYNSGKTNKFSTTGLGKAKGLRLNMKYPISWKSIEGERPHVVRKFVQPDNYALSIILVNKLDKPFTNAEIDELFTTEGLKSIISENSNFISSNPNLKIEGLKAGSIDYSTSAVRMDRHFNSYNRFYVFVYKEYFVMIQFMVLNKIGESDLSVNSRFNTLKPLFYQMFNSIVIDNIWE